MSYVISFDKVVPSNQTLLKARSQSRPCHHRAVDTVVSIYRQFRYWAFFFTHRSSCPYAHPVTKSRQWKKKSRGLCVLLHGLRSHPVAWDPQVSLLKQKRDIDIFAPCVPHKGMCSLEAAATPILQLIVDYAKKNPKKPVCILGVSNGSRLAMWLETQLRKQAPTTPVKVSTIAGVHFGSSRMQLLKQVGLADYLYPPVLVDELSFGSQRAKELLRAVLSPLPKQVAPRNYEFYATPTDMLVPDLGSSLPQLNKGEKAYILHGHSHDSIVAAVAEEQINSCVQWMEEQGRERI